ncbi:hypothetical protein C4D60_Mb02t07460 [Musa balbisiana]|uniref:Uncharacterized protein n=1 Tax=Musa balbisiana TaxID=52838 RepID=A0A4S8I8Y9_MUSBA|nr:hypothetical protein C4D60_Mb02t07460 [Musa balbisiana]
MDRSGSRRRSTGTAVVAVEVMEGTSKAEEWSGGAGDGGEGGEAVALQTGDIVEEVTFGAEPPARSPFRGGRSGIMKLLHAAYRRGDTSVVVRARRGPEATYLDFHARVVPHPAAGRRQYVLRSVRDPRHAVRLVDRSESDCITFQGSWSSRVVSALNNAQLHDGFVSYPWEKKMKETLPAPSSSCFLSLLVLPKASDPSSTSYNPVEDTLARTDAWLSSSQASGVPIVFVHIQTESLLTKVRNESNIISFAVIVSNDAIQLLFIVFKISGETASTTVNMGSLADLSNVANASLYGFEDYHGVDIGVVRAVRLWYAPAEGEMAFEIEPREGDTKLGISISRTEEGFIYISSVEDDDGTGVTAGRSGLKRLYKAAAVASKLLVVSRVGTEKVLPWMVSTSGAIRCFDTVSLSQKLSLHRHALKPILLHLLMWETSETNVTTTKAESDEDPTPMSPPYIVPRASDGASAAASSLSSSPGRDVLQDAARDLSFRFCDLSIWNTSI